MTEQPDLTVGELVKKVEALGTYTHVGPHGDVWHLEYMGSCRIDDSGDWLDWQEP